MSSPPQPARGARRAGARVTIAAVALTGGWAGALAAALPPHAVEARTARAAAYVDGAPPGFAGGFDEGSCHACHFDAEPNTSPGSTTLSGAPDTFVPGRRYPLTIRLTHPDMRSGGFQLSARVAGAGTQAGSLAPAEGHGARVKVERQGGVEYASQRKDGASASADTVEWVIDWTAPDLSPGSVVQFHLAANAANGDESASGDYVFTRVVESRAAPR